MSLLVDMFTVCKYCIKASFIAKSVEINSGVEAHYLAHRLPNANTSLTNTLHKSIDDRPKSSDSESLSNPPPPSGPAINLLTASDL
ncbi:hypothetical protein N7449_003667 [Penicillium cf. viridicatum]|uniref:Uncharacterized protein n=1 Tax=Penicillium cf. viridicatum TaxID=2972119 RepID=A0A9W9MY02_9EURO|nr:hypothetical protein N7449_003667 [Penicillium cf. viridicatum]